MPLIASKPMKYLACALILAATPLAAEPARMVSFDLGVAAKVKPSYPGSDDTEVSAVPIIRNFRLGEGGGQAKQGLSFGPSWSIVGGRKADDDSRLSGFDDIDRAVELGGKLSYRMGDVTTFATLRRGFGGHEGLRGEIGASHHAALSDRLRLTSTLEAGFANDDYLQTYFGVDAKQSAASGYQLYTPEGGLHSVSAGVSARYDMGADWALLGEAKVSKLLGDAADSPLTRDEIQPQLSLGVVRHFNFGF